MKQEPLRILRVSTVDNLGGAARTAWGLHQAYRQWGVEDLMVVGKKFSDDPSVILMPNDEAKSLYTRIMLKISHQSEVINRYVRGTWRLSRTLKMLAEPQRWWDTYQGREDFSYPSTWRLLELLPEVPNIVHCHNLHGGYFDLRVLSWLSHKVPVILTLHDAWLLSGHCAHSLGCQRWKSGCGHCPDLTLYPAIRRDATAYNWQRKQKIYAKSQLYVTTPSSWLMQKVEQSILAPAILKRRVISNAIDLTVFHPGDKKEARSKLGFPQKADILLFIGQQIKRNPYRDYNMLESLVENLSQAPRSRPMFMVCVGEEGVSKKFGNVEMRFIPYQADPKMVARYYQAADLYLHPAKEETFGRVVVEALACGVPVVATAVGGILELIENGKTGFLVPPTDVEQMTQRVKQLLEDKDLWRALSQEAVKVACQQFDLNDQVETYLAWYKEILEERYNGELR